MKQLLLFFFFLFSMQLSAQIDSLAIKSDKSTLTQKKFDQKALENYKTQKEFDYQLETEQKDPTFFERVINWLGRQLFRLLRWIFGVEHASGIFSFILKAIPYVILLLVLLLMLKFFLKVNTKNVIHNSKNKPIVSITEEEALIKTKDLPKLIQQAIEQKNFRFAIRFYYLLILKQLEEKELIDWEQQKTNEDYIQEISEKNIQHSFKKLTRLYDFVWYGNFEINEIEFVQVEADFQKATKLIAK